MTLVGMSWIMHRKTIVSVVLFVDSGFDTTSALSNPVLHAAEDEDDLSIASTTGNNSECAKTVNVSSH